MGDVGACEREQAAHGCARTRRKGLPDRSYETERGVPVERVPWGEK